MRAEFLTQVCRHKCQGAPQIISTMDQRVTQFMEFVIDQLAVMQVIEGKIFQRVLDILEKDYQDEGNSYGSGDEGVLGSRPAADSDGRADS